ncbi:MAG: 6-phosphogluconolactonase [Asgard group archaeon]|nr:6-phosphogluconolactonase [Asgard group archaeon]
MTTTVPLIYSFPEFLGVADAVADHIITAQNQTLYNTTDLQQIELIKQGKANTPIHSPRHSQSGIDLTPSIKAALNSPLPRNGSSPAINNGVTSTTSSSSKSKKEKKIQKKQEQRFKIAISGGSLIKILHQGLLPRQDSIEWEKWDIYFADERLVPFDSPDSNYGQAKREIFDLIEGDKKPKIFHINESLIDDPQEAADDYEKQLISNFAKKDSVKLPLFDLLLLGCAPDGHIASLFPNHGEQLREKLAWVLPVTNAPLGPENRITLSIPIILHSSRVSFVVEGLTKAPIIKIIMERPEKGLPSSIVNEGAAGKVTWFVDDDALNDLYEKKVKKYVFTYK